MVKFNFIHSQGLVFLVVLLSIFQKDMGKHLGFKVNEEKWLEMQNSICDKQNQKGWYLK